MQGEAKFFQAAFVCINNCRLQFQASIAAVWPFGLFCRRHGQAIRQFGLFGMTGSICN